ILATGRATSLGQPAGRTTRSYSDPLSRAPTGPPPRAANGLGDSSRVLTGHLLPGCEPAGRGDVFRHVLVAITGRLLPGCEPTGPQERVQAGAHARSQGTSFPAASRRVAETYSSRCSCGRPEARSDIAAPAPAANVGARPAIHS